MSRKIEFMRKRKSKIILNKLIKENKNENSLIKIRSYVLDFFGENSPEYEHSKSITYKFKEIIMQEYTGNIKTQYNEKQRLSIIKNKEKEINEFLKNCIETIENKGLYKKHNNNLLSELNNFQLIGMFTTVIVFSVYLGIRLSENKIIREFFLTITNQ
ncbi:hypothetical protein FUA26_05410 [Seonamhaeicola algicola]|uniref:Uncharacterized protein n=2 Tax=Seonamhaeicola algicola TaxID=1719036 RepID=A0A5C7B3H2_9FLAO|nr:hypothetical protein FUA26_05410 [Seonamhaeicola algicola]